MSISINAAFDSGNIRLVRADGDRIEAKGVIDCRGPGNLSMLHCGWQKFYDAETYTVGVLKFKP